MRKPIPPRLLDEFAIEIRVGNYSYYTEQTYSMWTTHHIRIHNIELLNGMTQAAGCQESEISIAELKWNQ